MIITTQAVREMAERLGVLAFDKSAPAKVIQAASLASDMLLALVEERDSLYARLEMVEAYDGEGNRISVEPYSIPDGIEARDATIRLLDDRVKALTARVEAAEAERDRLAEANAKKADDIVDLG